MKKTIQNIKEITRGLAIDGGDVVLALLEGEGGLGTGEEEREPDGGERVRGGDYIVERWRTEERESV
uniref:Uncharacterized protein n=1 Tax=Fagus sylvatica TaxID=28930 RepID=A0A2N9EIC0_FAGSY